MNACDWSTRQLIIVRAILTFWLALCVPPAFGDIVSTRTSTADWQCTNEDGSGATNYQRQDTAIAACASAALRDGKAHILKGGTYRITTTTAPTGSKVQISWAAATQNTDGSPLTDLAGYTLSYGTAPDQLTQSVNVGNVLTYTVSGLASGAWYFAVASVNSQGTTSVVSNLVTAVVP